MIPILDKTVGMEMPGHYFSVVIDFVAKDFKIFDSYRTFVDEKLLESFRTVVRNIKNLWIEGFSKDASAKYTTISDFSITYADMPKQTNP